MRRNDHSVRYKLHVVEEKSGMLRSSCSRESDGRYPLTYSREAVIRTERSIYLMRPAQLCDNFNDTRNIRIKRVAFLRQRIRVQHYSEFASKCVQGVLGCFLAFSFIRRKFNRIFIYDVSFLITSRCVSLYTYLSD